MLSRDEPVFGQQRCAACIMLYDTASPARAQLLGWLLCAAMHFARDLTGIHCLEFVLVWLQGVSFAICMSA